MKRRRERCRDTHKSTHKIDRPRAAPTTSPPPTTSSHTSLHPGDHAPCRRPHHHHQPSPTITTHPNVQSTHHHPLPPSLWKLEAVLSIAEIQSPAYWPQLAHSTRAAMPGTHVERWITVRLTLSTHPCSSQRRTSARSACRVTCRSIEIRICNGSSHWAMLRVWCLNTSCQLASLRIHRFAKNLVSLVFVCNANFPGLVFRMS